MSPLLTQLTGHARNRQEDRMLCIVDVVDASCICTRMLFYDSEGALPDGCAKTLKKTARVARLASDMLQLTPGGHRACLR